MHLFVSQYLYGGKCGEDIKIWEIFSSSLAKIPIALQMDQYESTLLQISKGYKRKKSYLLRHKKKTTTRPHMKSLVTNSDCLHLAAAALHCSTLMWADTSSFTVNEKLSSRFHHVPLWVGDVQSISTENCPLQKILWSTVLYVRGDKYGRTAHLGRYTGETTKGKNLEQGCIRFYTHANRWDDSFDPDPLSVLLGLPAKHTHSKGDQRRWR